MTDLPSPDEVMAEIFLIERELATLHPAMQSAIQAHKEAQVNLVVAKAGLLAAEAHKAILDKRLSAKQSLLKGFPR